VTPTQLRAWRARLGLTQAEAAAEIRISLPQYKRLEGGRSEISGPISMACELVEIRAKPSAA